MRSRDATGELSRWLSRFEDALSAGDAVAAAELFTEAGYWRDLIAFTWNIKTSEGRDEITAMLDATLPGTKPSQWRLEGKADEADGVISGWITFETALARGKGHVRLKDGLCWTLLTTMTELKGHEERRGPTRELGAAHGAQQSCVHLGEADRPACCMQLDLLLPPRTPVAVHGAQEDHDQDD